LSERGWALLSQNLGTGISGKRYGKSIKLGGDIPSNCATDMDSVAAMIFPIMKLRAILNSNKSIDDHSATLPHKKN
jgi:hypothetical protein